MRKRIFGRRLRRDANERKALFKGLMSALVLEEGIKTTEAKAKAIRGGVEKLVTKARSGSTAARSILERHLTPPAIEKMISDLALRFANRPGGYTRTVKLGYRVADNAPMVLIEWVERGDQNAKIKDQKGETIKSLPAGRQGLNAPKSQKTTKKEAKADKKPEKPNRKSSVKKKSEKK